MVVYQLKEEIRWREDVGQYTTFGICACDAGDGQHKTVAYIPDVFLHRAEAAAFVERCNRLGLSVTHLSDAVCDALCC